MGLTTFLKNRFLFQLLSICILQFFKAKQAQFAKLVQVLHMNITTQKALFFSCPFFGTN